MSRNTEGMYFVEDVQRGKWSPAQRDMVIRQTARRDGQSVSIMLEQEPGSAGKSVADYLVRSLAGFTVSAERPTGAKEVRAQPLASQCGIRNVSLVKGEWNADFLDELAMFPNGRHDDQVDAASGAFSRLCRYGQQFVPPKFLRIERRPNCVQGDFSGARRFRYVHRSS